MKCNPSAISALFVSFRAKFFTGKKEIDVSMMNVVEEFSYINETDLQFESINLPYVNSSYAMNVILPYPAQTIKNVVRSLKDFSKS